MNYTSERPVDQLRYMTERLPQQPATYATSADHFGPWQQQDAMPNESFDADQAFRSAQAGLKKSRISRDPFCGPLPMLTIPKSVNTHADRLVPISTRSPTVRTDFTKSTESRGPLYLRQWPIWDNLPFLPSRGDVSLDPRYGTQTKGASTSYMSLS